ncbi:MAG TPA: putative toxin-antitoxin system toxin component, PIN family [Syntrophobacteria bacterium]|nr:putative toxin-antitoxin system toxin component, PIN family [Syntrophobacteria bacterium]
MRIVLDTNVLVSAFLKPASDAARVLRLVLQRDLEIVLNDHILAEYIEVLSRPRFGLDQRKVREVLDYLRSVGTVAPAVASSFRLPDPDDEPFLEAAVGGRAQFLVTGNKRHFPGRRCEGVKVVGPKEFFRELGS